MVFQVRVLQNVVQRNALRLLLSRQDQKPTLQVLKFFREYNFIVIITIFYGRGGSNWRNSPGNVSIHRQRGPSNYGGPLYTTHKRDQDANNCDQWEASVGCNDYGLTGPLLDHARGSVSFVCVFLHRPSY